jgi:hypothetical protein
LRNFISDLFALAEMAEFKNTSSRVEGIRAKEGRAEVSEGV